MTSTSATPPPADADWQVAQQVDQWCLKYEDHWLGGQRPDLAEHLREAPAEIRQRLLPELLELDAAYAVRQGREAGEEDYQDLPADCRDIVRRFFQGRTPPDALQVGARIGRFELLERLGGGGFGEVYRAHDLELHRQVALKLPRAEAAWSPHGRVQFLEEARTAARLNHPRLAKIHDVGRLDDGGCFLVMPLLQGSSLRTRLEQGGPTPLEAADLLAQVADGVQALHHGGLVHRDLSPDNIMLDSEYGPVVIDFGLAMFLNTGGRREVAGSRRYMAPEQVRGDTSAINARTDVWALGAVLWEMLAGRPPFLDDDPRVLEEKILGAAPEGWPHPSPPAALRRICDRCLRKAPAERYANAGRVAEELRRWLSGVRHRRLLLGAAGATILGAAGTLAAARGLNGLGTSPPATLTPPRITAELQVLHGVWRRLTPESAWSLAAGDGVRLRIRSLESAHLYVLWRDAAGRLAPLHPFIDQQWLLPEIQRPQTQLDLPAADPAQVWTMEVPQSGIEAVLVLAARQPVRRDDLDAVQRVLRRPWPTISESPPWCVRYHNGVPVHDRGPGRASSPRVDPLTRMQRGWFEELRRWFDEVLVIATAVSGTPGDAASP